MEVPLPGAVRLPVSRLMLDGCCRPLAYGLPRWCSATCVPVVRASSASLAPSSSGISGQGRARRRAAARSSAAHPVGHDDGGGDQSEQLARGPEEAHAGRPLRACRAATGPTTAWKGTASRTKSSRAPWGRRCWPGSTPTAVQQKSTADDEHVQVDAGVEPAVAQRGVVERGGVERDQRGAPHRPHDERDGSPRRPVGS